MKRQIVEIVFNGWGKGWGTPPTFVLVCGHSVSPRAADVIAAGFSTGAIAPQDLVWYCPICQEEPMKTCYYAHCMAIYSTPQEARDLAALTGLGFHVLNPNSGAINLQVASIRNAGDLLAQGGGFRDASERVMVEIFKPLAQSCDVLAFRAMPDGSIPCGVAKEIQWAIEAGKTILELPSALKRRTLSLQETREWLKEAGQR